MTSELPTAKDANPETGTVLLWVVFWGWQNSPWRNIKPGEKWKRGYIREKPEPRPQPVRNAWT
jgi:hypothetical protein